MNNGFNANDFRAQRETETAQKNVLVDGMMIVAIFCMGLVGLGLFGYNKLTEYNAKKAGEADMLILAMEEGYTGSTEDARANIALRQKSSAPSKSKPSGPNDLFAGMSKSRDPRVRRLIASQEKTAANAPKSVVEFVTAKNMTGSSAQLVRYRRTVGVLKQCGNGYGKMLDFYENQNRPKYNALKKRIATQQKTSPSQDINAANQELGNVKDQKSALKFIAGGGASRHGQASMKMMGSMDAMFGEEKYRGALTAQDCQTIKQKAQTAQLNIRL